MSQMLLKTTITSSNTFTVEENQTSIEVTTSSSSVTSLSGDDSALITISSAGLLEFVDAPDYESPQDAGANNIYNITVTATDSAGSATQNITTTVTAERAITLQICLFQIR